MAVIMTQHLASAQEDSAVVVRSRSTCGSGYSVGLLLAEELHFCGSDHGDIPVLQGVLPSDHRTVHPGHSLTIRMRDEESFGPFVNNEGGITDQKPSELDVGRAALAGGGGPFGQLDALLVDASGDDRDAPFEAAGLSSLAGWCRPRSSCRAFGCTMIVSSAREGLLDSRFLTGISSSFMKTSVCLPTRISSLCWSIVVLTFFSLI